MSEQERNISAPTEAPQRAPEPHAGESENPTALTREVIGHMTSGYDDDEIGRYHASASGDPSDFDAMPIRMADVPGYTQIDELDHAAAMDQLLQSGGLIAQDPALVHPEGSETEGDDYLDANEEPVDSEHEELSGASSAKARIRSKKTFLAADDERPTPFESPADTQFPVFEKALAHFQAAEVKPRVVRVDTPETYDQFVSDAAVRELSRRVAAVEAALAKHVDEDAIEHDAIWAALKQHISDPHAHARATVLGATEALKNMRSAKDGREAASKLPQVALDLPSFADGKVHCWRDGDCIVCSMHFTSAEGEHRIATSAMTPREETAEVLGIVSRRGIDPVALLGVLSDLAAQLAGKKLVREIAGVALKARERQEVCGMDGSEPLLLTRVGATETGAPLAATMYLLQRCQKGDQAACEELRKMRIAASTPEGKKLVAPVLAEAAGRLAAGQEKKKQDVLGTGVKGFFKRLMSGYAHGAGW